MPSRATRCHVRGVVVSALTPTAFFRAAIARATAPDSSTVETLLTVEIVAWSTSIPERLCRSWSVAQGRKMGRCPQRNGHIKLRNRPSGLTATRAHARYQMGTIPPLNRIVAKANTSPDGADVAGYRFASALHPPQKAISGMSTRDRATMATHIRAIAARSFTRRHPRRRHGTDRCTM